MRAYQVVVVHYVPDAARDERVGIGVIVRDPKTREFSFAFGDRLRVLNEMGVDTKLAGQVITDFTSTLTEAKEKGASLGWMGNPGDPDFFQKARREFTGTLQLGPVRSSRGDSLDNALEQARLKLLADHAPVAV